MAITMEVNGENISAYNAKFWSIMPGKRNIENSSEMLDNAAAPLLFRPVIGIREYTLTLHVYGASREEIWRNVGGLLKLFTEVVGVSIGSGHGNAPGFNGFNRYFRLSLLGVKHSEYGIMKSRWHTLELTCVGYEHGVEMSCGVDFEVIEQGPAYGSRTLTFESYIDDMDINPSFGNVQKTEAAVTVDVRVLQMYKCQDDGGYFTGLAGNHYPMYADISIKGLCKNSMGKDAGSLTISTVPEFVPAEPTMAPGPSGYGVESISVNGMTGAHMCDYNGATPDPGSSGVSTLVEVPAPMRWGFPRQKIKVSITAHRTDIYQAQYSIYFKYTPIYL